MEYLEFLPLKRLKDRTTSDNPSLFASNRLIHDDEVYQIIKEDYLYDIASQRYMWNNDFRFLEIPGPKRFLSDLEILKETFFYNIKVLAYVSNELKSSKEFIKTAVEINPFALQFVSEQLKDDDDLVHLAVEINPFALQFASERLKNDESLQLKFVLYPDSQARYQNVVEEREERKGLFNQLFNISEEDQKFNTFVESIFNLFFQSVNIDHQLKLIEKNASFLKYLDPVHLEQ